MKKQKELKNKTSEKLEILLTHEYYNPNPEKKLYDIQEISREITYRQDFVRT